MRLTTLARVKNALGGMTNIQAADEAFIKGRIARLSALAEREMDRHAERKSRDELFNIEERQNRLFLKGFPITGTVDVFEDPDREFTSDDELDDDDYVVDKNSGVITLKNNFFAPGPQLVKVSYTGGMAKTVDRLEVTLTNLGGSLAAGQTVKGQDSEAKGTLKSIDTGTGKATIQVTEGDFEEGEEIQDVNQSNNKGTISTIDESPFIMKFADITDALTMQIIHEYQRRTNVGGESVTLAGSISARDEVRLLREVKDVLRRYKRSVF